MQNNLNNLTDMAYKFIIQNSASTLGSGSLPSDIVANPRGDMKAITTRSGVSYDGPQVPPPPSSLPKVVEHEPEGWTFLRRHKLGSDVHGHSPYNTIELVNRVDVIDVACEEFAQGCTCICEFSKSGNPTLTLEPILSTSPTSVTPFEGGDFILEEIEACLTSESIPPRIDDADFDPEENLLTLERLLNSDPTSTLPLEETKIEDLTTLKHSKGTALLKVLRSHKRVIAWKMSDIKGIDPKFCTHKILMEDNVKPTVQHQRRVNLKIHEVIKKEVIKLLEAGLIYPISDSP
ncbi:hypothetical protein Tco_0077795 [Tanacetum coccineum]